jgi:hypothetical protein
LPFPFVGVSVTMEDIYSGIIPSSGGLVAATEATSCEASSPKRLFHGLTLGEDVEFGGSVKGSAITPCARPRSVMHIVP